MYEPTGIKLDSKSLDMKVMTALTLAMAAYNKLCGYSPLLVTPPPKLSRCVIA
jgi:hypothetical protein